MNKRKLIALPLIVVMVIAMMGFTVLAAGGSASSGFKVYESDGTDVTSGFHGESVTGIDLSKVSGLLAKIDKVNNKLKVKDYTAQTAKALGGKIEIVDFVRFEKGEGLEKRSDDFAAEVASMVK